MHTKLSSLNGKKLENQIKGIIGSYKLNLEKKNIRIKENTIFYGDAKVLTLIQEGNKTYLKTEKLV